ncbi:class I SAM-dependent methyltransferase [Tabrizicola caldifontis]|uniref:hypothetical protein n=1 Tax=Tabrizicola caldifontis TaxID=2528036 RepID=UPI001080DAFA|nr:hypothetical protein [Rhodobacter sp. YIM 73028]
MFRRPRGYHYLDFLSELHRCILFDWYLEIGCRTGASLAPVRGKAIAVDPRFRVRIDVIRQKPALHMFQTTSDDFFASGFLQANRIRPGVSFLDGMHLFEYLLRDFIGTETASDPEGVILMHDCVPIDSERTTRDLAAVRGAWTGDVWKLVPILRKWRPDLKMTMLDLRPTGMLCVTNLSPGNTVLRDNYDRIVAEYLDQTIESFGVARFFGLFDFAPSVREVAEGFPMFRPIAIDPSDEEVPRPLGT